MSFTRFNNDEARIKKQLQESTDIGRYMLNVPGNGDKPLYMNDPNIRLQKFGGNRMENPVQLESDLFGMLNKLDKDCLKKINKKVYKQVNYNNGNLNVGQSRITNPPWMYRALDQTKNSILPLDPQANLEPSFTSNVDTRLIHMDEYNNNNI